MDERVVQFRVGVLVLATLMITMLLILLFGELPSFARPTYTLVVHLENAYGLAPGSPVRKSGILIGRVKEIEFAQGGGVDITVEIDREIPIHRDEICELRIPLFGETELEFVRDPNAVSGGSSTPGAVQSSI